MKKVIHLREHSKDVELNNVLFMERRAMRKNVLKFAAFMVLVALVAMWVLHLSFSIIPSLFGA